MLPVLQRGSAMLAVSSVHIFSVHRAVLTAGVTRRKTSFQTERHETYTGGVLGCANICPVAIGYGQNMQVYQLMPKPMTPARRLFCRPIDHCAVYTAQRRVSANVVGCIGSNSIGSICCTICCTASCVTNPQQIDKKSCKMFYLTYSHKERSKHYGQPKSSLDLYSV